MDDSNGELEGQLKTPESLSGFETAKLAEEVYSTLGPDNGCRMVEPSAILTLAGLKSIADIQSAKYDEAEVTKADEVDFLLQQRDITLRCIPHFPQRAIGALLLSNLNGLAYTTSRTKLPGYSPFVVEQGSDRIGEWEEAAEAKQRELIKQGVLDPAIDLSIYLQGIQLGYPDQAIIDFEHCFRSGDPQGDLQEADILSVSPYAQEYHGAVPEFDFYPASANDRQIVDYITKARRVLQDFYATLWFQKLTRNADFQQARQRQNQRHSIALAMIREQRRNG